MINEIPKDILSSMIGKISEVMGNMDKFQDSRSGSIAFTKLEEAMMWLQVMVHNVPLKPLMQDVKVEERDTIPVDTEE
jgi:hypothetical protein